MTKLTLVNSLMAGLMLLSSISSLRLTYNNAQKYGWTYNQTIIVYSESTEEYIGGTTIVSSTSQIIGSLFLALFGILYLFNNSAIRNSLRLEIGPTEMTGISFPFGDPEFWDVGVDLRTRAVEVTLNESKIVFPLTMILGWVDEHENQKMDDMK